MDMAVTENLRSITMTAEDDAVTTSVEIDSVEFALPSGTAGNQCVLTDTNGSLIAHIVARTTNFSERVPIGRRYNGVIAATLDGGTVYIHKR